MTVVERRRIERKDGGNQSLVSCDADESLSHPDLKSVDPCLETYEGPRVTPIQRVSLKIIIRARYLLRGK
jgi:hypothetical protein